MADRYGLPDEGDLENLLLVGLIRDYAEENITEQEWADAHRKAEAVVKLLGADGVREALFRVLRSNHFDQVPTCAADAAKTVLADRAAAKKMPRRRAR